MEVKFNDDTIELWFMGIYRKTFYRTKDGWTALANLAFAIGLEEGRND